MYVRLNETVRDKETNEIIMGNNPFEQVIAEVSDIDYSQPWSVNVKTSATGDHIIRNDCYSRVLLQVGDWVKLKSGEKVVVISATETGFSYLQPDGKSKRVSYISVSDDSLNFTPCATPKNYGKTFQLGLFAHTYEKFSEQMHKYYARHCDERYIYKNFINYANKKIGLINLLRKHPSWNEDQKAIILKCKVAVQPDVQEATKYAHELYSRSRRITPKDITDNDLINILYYMSCSSYYRVSDGHPATVTPYLLGRINNAIHRNIPEGTKATKILRMICTEYCDANKFDDFEKIYAAYSDALSSKTKTIKFVVSANICDYVTMSHGNSWSSCHSFKSYGGWHCGCLSYANDYVTLVVYGVDADTPNADIFDAPKIFRNLFMINEDQTEYIQSRIYPTSSIFSAFSCNEIFSRILAECGASIGSECCMNKRGSYSKGIGSLQYHDYDRFGNRYGGNTTNINIGGEVYNLGTGRIIASPSSMSTKFVENSHNRYKYTIVKNRKSSKSRTARDEKSVA